MKQTVYFDDFRQAFNNMDRGNQFSCDALELIYEYLEECVPDLELDVIAICCEYSEDDYESIASSYSIDLKGIELEELQIEAVRKYLEDNTSLVGEPSYGVFVYQQF